MIARVLVAVAVLAGLVGLCSPARAEDRRPCVSKAEYLSMAHELAPMTSADRRPLKREIESAWDVRGVGHHDRALSGQYLVGYDYPTCEGGGTEAWALYNRESHQVRGIAWSTNHQVKFTVVGA